MGETAVQAIKPLTLHKGTLGEELGGSAGEMWLVSYSEHFSASRA